MRHAWALFGLWLGACATAPARDGAGGAVPASPPLASPAPPAAVAHAEVAAFVPVVRTRPRPVRVLVGGDVIPHRPQLVDPASMSAALEPLAPLFLSADAAVVNYETATGTIPGDTSPMSLGASPDWMRSVVDANVTALTFANNHACDLGRRGLAASIDTAHAVGVTALGAAAGDPWDAQTIATQGDKRVCAVAWTTFVNDLRRGCAEAGHLAIAAPQRAGRLRVARAIEEARRKGCDAVVAIVHGGEEYAPQTSAMLKLARAAADAGADAVVIHHPHVVSPLVVYAAKDGRRVPIFASVGNLVSNQGESWTPAYPAAQANRHLVYLNGWTRLGMIADLSFRFDGRGRQRLARWGYHLVFVDSDHVRDRSNPHPHIDARPLDPDADRPIIDKLARDAAGPREVFDDACWMEKSDATSPPCRP
jgi:hypothetical protein